MPGQLERLWMARDADLQLNHSDVLALTGLVDGILSMPDAIGGFSAHSIYDPATRATEPRFAHGDLVVVTQP